MNSTDVVTHVIEKMGYKKVPRDSLFSSANGRHNLDMGYVLSLNPNADVFTIFTKDRPQHGITVFSEGVILIRRRVYDDSGVADFIPEVRVNLAEPNSLERLEEVIHEVTSVG